MKKYLLRVFLIVVLLFPLTLFAQSSGTGFLISNDGYLVTAYHVVEDATKITVRGVNQDFSKKYEARVIATDKVNDIAIIKINCRLSSPIRYSFKWNVSNVGEEVFTLGYPLKTTMGEEIKLTDGIISSRSGFRGEEATYQITTPVQPGSSGGPLFNDDGYVIGLISAKHTGAENAGYAVKSHLIRNLIYSVKSNIDITNSNYLRRNSLSDQVKLARKDVLLIETNTKRSILEDFKPINVKTKSEAKLKDKPGVLGDVISYIPKNTSVKIVGKKESFWKVFYKGKIGYSHELYFEETYETLVIKEAEKISKMPPAYQKNNEVTKISNRAKMRNEPSVLGDIIKNIPEDEIIYVVGFQDGYWKIFHDGQKGYLMDGLYFDVTYEMVRFKN